MNLHGGAAACIAVGIGVCFAISAHAQTIHECVSPQGAGGGLTLGPDGYVWFLDGAAKCGTTPPGPGGAVCGLGRVALDCTGYRHFPLPEAVVRRATPSGAKPDASEFERFGPFLGPLAESIVARSGDPSGLGPMDITTGADGNLWFTNYFSGTPFIGRMTTKGEFSQFSLNLFLEAAKRVDPGRPAFAGWPIAPSPYEIEAGPDGRIYFSVQDQWSNAGEPTNDVSKQSWIGRFDPVDPIGTLSSWTVPGMAAAIIVGDDGNMWFTTIPRLFSGVGGGIGRIETRNGAISFWPYPWPPNLGAKIVDDRTAQMFASIGVGWTTSYLAAAPDGTIWFTQENVASIGRFSPEDGSFTYYTEGLREGDWHFGGIVAGDDGYMYAVDMQSGDMYKISLKGDMTIIDNPVVEPGAPAWMIKMPDGNIWTAGHLSPSIQRLEFSR